MVLTKFILLFIISFKVFAAIILPKFSTKQAINTLRFITLDGKISFSQKKNGSLNYSTNYRSQDILTKKPNTEYNISSSYVRKKFLIEAQENPLTIFDMNKENEIYSLFWGQNDPKLIGKGTNPQLHLEDAWASIYKPTITTLEFIKLSLDEKPWSITLARKHNPYYRPGVIMLSSDTVIYTDINDQGFSALIKYSAKTAQTTLLYKSTQMGTRLEICQNKTYVAVGEFPYDGLQRGSAIYTVNTTGTTNYSLQKAIYKSTDNDIGNIICAPEQVYFVKTLSENKRMNLKTTEVAEVHVKTGQVSIKSDLEKITQIISLDGRILVPFREEYFVIAGEANISQDQLIKKNPKLPGDE